MFWTKGRQNSGYLKLCLASFWFFDLYILRYPTGSSIKPHRDPVPGKKHYRFNVELKKAKEGGEFTADSYLWRKGRAVLFRSDEATHQVSEIKKGERYVLSLGWVR